MFVCQDHNRPVFLFQPFFSIHFAISPFYLPFFKSGCVDRTLRLILSRKPFLIKSKLPSDDFGENAAWWWITEKCLLSFSGLCRYLTERCFLWET